MAKEYELDERDFNKLISTTNVPVIKAEVSHLIKFTAVNGDGEKVIDQFVKSKDAPVDLITLNWKGMDHVFSSLKELSGWVTLNSPAPPPAPVPIPIPTPVPVSAPVSAPVSITTGVTKPAVPATPATPAVPGK